MADPTAPAPSAAKPSVRDRIRQGLAATKERSREISGVVTHLAKHKRLFVPKASDDFEYEAAERPFLEAVKHITSMRENINNYLNSLRGARVAQVPRPECPRRTSS